MQAADEKLERVGRAVLCLAKVFCRKPTEGPNEEEEEEEEEEEAAEAAEAEAEAAAAEEEAGVVVDQESGVQTWNMCTWGER